MLDEDFCCESCLKEGILRRFFFYPNHTQARVVQLPSDNKYNCSICGGAGVRYSVSIMMNSIDKNKLVKEREMILEAEAHRKQNNFKKE